MIIQEEDFKLEEEEGGWNLYLLKHIGGDNPRDEMKLIGYGYSLFYAFRKIVWSRIERKKEVCSLKEFTLLYKEESDKLYQILKCLDGIRSVTI